MNPNYLGQTWTDFPFLQSFWLSARAPQNLGGEDQLSCTQTRELQMQLDSLLKGLVRHKVYYMSGSFFLSQHLLGISRVAEVERKWQNPSRDCCLFPPHFIQITCRTPPFPSSPTLLIRKDLFVSLFNHFCKKKILPPVPVSHSFLEIWNLSPQSNSMRKTLSVLCFPLQTLLPFKTANQYPTPTSCSKTLFSSLI